MFCSQCKNIYGDKNILENQAVRLGGQVEEEERIVTGDTDERRNSKHQQEQSRKQTPLAVCPVTQFPAAATQRLPCSHPPFLVATRAPCRVSDPRRDSRVARMR
jgi:hypothetical protein